MSPKGMALLLGLALFSFAFSAEAMREKGKNEEPQKNAYAGTDQPNHGKTEGKPAESPAERPAGAFRESVEEEDPGFVDPLVNVFLEKLRLVDPHYKPDVFGFRGTASSRDMAPPPPPPLHPTHHPVDPWLPESQHPVSPYHRADGEHESTAAGSGGGGRSPKKDMEVEAEPSDTRSTAVEEAAGGNNYEEKDKEWVGLRRRKGVKKQQGREGHY